MANRKRVEMGKYKMSENILHMKRLTRNTISLIATVCTEKHVIECCLVATGLCFLPHISNHISISSYELLGEHVWIFKLYDLVASITTGNRFIGNPPQSKLHCRGLFKDQATSTFGISLWQTLCDNKPALKRCLLLLFLLWFVLAGGGFNCLQFRPVHFLSKKSWWQFTLL